MVGSGLELRVGVIGTGVMGPDVALSFASAQIPTILVGRSDSKIRNAVQRLVEWVNLYGAEMGVSEAILLEVLKTSTELDSVRGCSLVIEAITEDLSAKRKLFSDLEAVCSSSCILASNTSGLAISQIAEATVHPERVVGTHFWNPAHLLPLVEVVRGERTSDLVVTAVCEILKRIGKVPVIVNAEVPGFIGTRLQQALIREAYNIVERGIATFEDVDAVVKYGFGRRLGILGPFETSDLGGLDTFARVTYVWADLSNASECPKTLKERVEKGYLGAKTGKGFYEWTEEKLRHARFLRDRVLWFFLRLQMEENKQGGGADG